MLLRGGGGLMGGGGGGLGRMKIVGGSLEEGWV